MAKQTRTTKSADASPEGKTRRRELARLERARNKVESALKEARTELGRRHRQVAKAEAAIVALEGKVAKAIAAHTGSAPAPAAAAAKAAPKAAPKKPATKAPVKTAGKSAAAKTGAAKPAAKPATRSAARGAVAAKPASAKPAGKADTVKPATKAAAKTAAKPATTRRTGSTTTRRPRLARPRAPAAGGHPDRVLVGVARPAGEIRHKTFASARVPHSGRGVAPVIAASADAGSNSVHLFVAVVSGHRLEPILDESAFLGLGGAVDERGRLGRMKRAELSSTLGRFAGIARDLGAASITFVATEPLRRAKDAKLAIRDVEKATLVPFHVLSHEEEGYLTLLGVTHGRQPAADLVVVDVGGGSSEFVVVGPDRGAAATGVRVGSARLTASWVSHDPPTPDEVEALRAAAREKLDGAPVTNPRSLVAVGGTATNLLKVVPAAALDRVLTRARLQQAMDILISEPAAYAAIHHAVNPIRARVLPAGVAIMEAILERYGRDRISVVDTGVREGAVLAATHGGTTWRADLESTARGWR